MRKLSITVFVLLATVSQGRGAGAQPNADEQARVQYKLGFELFEAGMYEQSAIALRKAYELKPSWKILYNLAQAENNANRFAAALDAYTKYLAEGGNDIPRERVEQVKAELERLNALVGMLVFQGAPHGAEIFIGKEFKGRVPLDGPLFLDLGRHEITVNHDGSRIFEQVVTVAGGEKALLEVGPSIKSDTGADEGVSITSSMPTGPTVSYPRIWTWVAAGVGGAALIGTAVTGGIAISKRNHLDDACPDRECPPSEMGRLDSARAVGNAATALTVVAGVGIAATAVLFFIEPGFGAERPSTAVNLAPMPSGGAVTLRREF